MQNSSSPKESKYNSIYVMNIACYLLFADDISRKMLFIKFRIKQALSLLARTELETYLNISSQLQYTEFFLNTLF